MPILQFSGKFKNYPPYYNNYAWNQERYFDSKLSPDDVKSKITEGVEPLQYFEFEFSNVYISKITYSDGSPTANASDDAMIGKEIMLKGLLVDTSPHLERGRLFAGEVRIMDLLLAKLSVAVQSDLFRSIRDIHAQGSGIFSADFQSTFYDSTHLPNEFVKKENSRFVRELDGDYNNLKIYFNVNSFDHKSLEGDVYGYIGPSLPIENKHGVRISGRRLLVDPTVTSELKQDFGIRQSNEHDDLEPTDDVQRNDMEGSYEIIEDEKLVILRYFNFVPFQDINHKLPENYRFFITPFQNEESLSSTIDIDLSEKAIARDGGICIFRIPQSIQGLDKFRLEIGVSKNSSKEQTFLKELRYDLILKDNQKFLTLYSGKKEHCQLRIYENNKLCTNNNITIILESKKHALSPMVAWWSSSSIVTGADSGTVTCCIEARDLENSEEVEDPLLPKLSEKEKPHMISGELPWDRYYGNYLYMKIEYDQKPTIKQNIPVRVLHSVSSTDVEKIDSLDKERIRDIVSKLLSYYARYYPWLHVGYRYIKDDDNNGNPKPIYVQFLRIKEYLDCVSRDDLHDWHSCQEAVEKINHFLERLERNDDDWKKMPRSRDFPNNGIEFLKAWKSSLLNKQMQDITENKNKIIEDNKNIVAEDSMDVNEWSDVEKLVNELDKLIELLPSLSNEEKKVLLLNKIAIYQFMLERVNDAKFQTEHEHSH